MMRLRPLETLLAVGGWLVFATLTVVAACIVLVLAPFDPGHRRCDTIARFWARSIFVLSGTRVLHAGMLGLPGPGPYIVMANHESHLDPPLLIWKFPRRLRFVAKIELFYIPFFGQGMLILGHIPIDRRNLAKAIRSLQRAGEKVRSGTNVLVFPEGTRNDHPDGPLLPFKKGGFRLALEARVPILPVGIAGTAAVLPKGAWRFHRGRTVHVVVGEPIPTADRNVEELEALMDEVYAVLSALRERARHELAEATR